MTPARADALRPLRAFAQVARFGSVSRAAESLGISQPAVTLQLQALAREHGVVLLQRSGRRLVPTDAGQALLALARPLVDGIDGLGAALQSRLQAQSPGALSVAAGGIALRQLLPGALRAWNGTPVHLQHGGGGDALALLRGGDCTLAVGSWLDVPGDIEFQPLLHSPACLVVPSAHRLAGVRCPTPADLAGHGLVLPATRRTTRQLVDLAYGRAGLDLVVAREAGDWPAVLQLVALGQGITISTALAVAPGDDAGLVARPLPAVFPTRPYGVAWRRGRTPGPAALRFIDALRDVAGSLEAGWASRA
ncbi:MAG TPA: LysR family transcriptional regulator [Xanthomonadaceae bacterium]|nr:LysR family transcriptional regulator [Xanthomonadaceae bacterium]